MSRNVLKTTVNNDIVKANTSQTKREIAVSSDGNIQTIFYPFRIICQSVKARYMGVA